MQIINSTVFEEGPASKFSTPHPPPPIVQRHVFVDPWDYVLNKQPEQTDSTNLETEDVIDRLVEHLKQTQHHHQAESHNSTEHFQHRVSTPHNQPTYMKQYSAPDLSHNKENFVKESSQTHSNILNQQKKTQSLQHLQQRPLRNKYGQLYTQREDTREEPLRRVESYDNIPSTISPPFTPSCVEKTSFLTKSEESTAVTEEVGCRHI
uniref:Tenascin-R n=1 Tax=Lygus hesperus TaxID=30085 RepID=A0A0A9XRP9_LYGHE